MVKKQEEWQEDLSNYVMSRGIFVEEMIPIPDGKPYEIQAIYGSMCKGGMSVKISVIDGIMVVSPYGYNGECHKSFRYSFLCPDCNHKLTSPTRFKHCPLCGQSMDLI